MRLQGRLTEWNDERGFGFITPLDGSATVFAHVSAFPRQQRRPIETDLVTFIVEHDERGRRRAAGIQYLAPTCSRSATTLRSARSSSARFAAIAAVVFFGLLGAMGLIAPLAWILMLAYLAVSVVAFLSYRADKSAAQQSRRRTEEGALHLLSLMGGWPGALMAQQLYRHKTSKTSFQVTFWGTVILNVVSSTLLIAASIDITPPV